MIMSAARLALAGLGLNVMDGHGRTAHESCLVAHPTARKWVITPGINGISRVNPLIIGVKTHLRAVG